MHTRYLVIVIVLGLGCGTAPPVVAPIVSPAHVEPLEVVVPLEAPDPHRIDGFAAGTMGTCLLRASRLRCFGSPEVDLEVDADLLHVGSDTYCVARSGRSEITCRGEVIALHDPGEQEENWRMECDGDQDCVDREWDAWSARVEAEGLRLSTARPLRALAGGDGSVCALDDAGGITCFDLASGDPAADPVTFTVNGATQLAMNLMLGCTLIGDGTVSCWDEGEDEVRATPIEGVRGAVRVAVASSFACAWDGEGRATCWGWAMPFDDDALDEGVARRVPALDGALDLVGSENGLGDFTCAVLRDGRVRCAGDNVYGQLGRAPSEGDREEEVVTLELQHVLRIAVGESHACAVAETGAIDCWGRADGGALGAAHTRTDWSPIEVSGVLADRVVADGNRTCARSSEGWSCWGRDDYADRRAHPWEPRRSLAPREGEPLRVSQDECALVQGTLRCPDRPDVALRAIDGACIITPDRRVACERSGSFEDVDVRRDAIAIAMLGTQLAVLAPGELRVITRRYGQPPRVQTTFPVGTAPIRELAISYTRVCLRRADGGVHCAEMSGSALEPAELPPSEQLVSTGSGMCSRGARGVVHCWNGAGPARESSPTPVLVPGLEAVELAAGDEHVCARNRRGAVFCWGADAAGQLGMRPAWWTDGPVPVSLDAAHAP